MLGIKPKFMQWTEVEKGINGYNFAYGHIYPRLRDKFMPMIEDSVTIMPLRHPLLTAKSWLERSGNMDELVETWELLVNEIDPHGPIYLPIDSPRRDEYLDNLNMHLGTDIQTDWKPVGSFKGNHALRHQDISGPPIIHELSERISGFLGRFYD